MVLAWKCYRCHLYFREEVHARTHADVTNHSPSRVRMAVA